MRHRKVYWIVALLTFFVGLMASGTWLVLKRGRVLERPTYPTTSTSRTSICELLTKPTSDQLPDEVQVRAILVGFHDITLYEPNCHSAINAVVVNLSTEQRDELISSVAKLGDSAYQRGNFWVMVTLRGKFRRMETPRRVETGTSIFGTSLRLSNRYQLDVSDIQEVDYVPSNIDWPK